MSVKSSLWNSIFILNKSNTILLEVSHILCVCFECLGVELR